MKTEALPLEAVEQAIQATKDTLEDLTHHCDHGSQYTSIAYNEKLADYGFMPSTGTVGDSYDNALVEAVNGLYKAELIYCQPWVSLTKVESATLNWVHWWNHERFHEALGYNSPAQIIDMYNQARVSELIYVQTLSSGERHRAAVALVLAEEPDWIVLDDTLAALDPATRDSVSKVIFANVSTCTIITSSEEYIPTYLRQSVGAKSQDSAESLDSIQAFARAANQVDPNKNRQQKDLPDPFAKRATFWRSVNLLFGANIIWIVLGAMLLAGSEVGFAVVVAGANSLSPQVAHASGACALGALVGSLIFFGPIYRAPISRLSALHERIVCRIDRFASPQTSGAVVARVGEDFSDLQMSVPGAMG